MHFWPFKTSPVTAVELTLAVVTTIVVLEAARRTIGWVFPILTAIFLAYTLWGDHIPGQWGHAYIAPPMILQYLYLSSNGIWGFLTGISARFLALFLIFGSLLLTTGAGDTLIKLAILGAGRFRGGPAKVAVVASGFFAMLSGSAIANVVTTGSFTIPMMKKLGYRREFAGGVEAVSSCGGGITPPVMGASAFIMAEFLGIPYLKVIIAAAIPASLYYLSVFTSVHFHSVKHHLVPIPREELPQAREVFTWSRMMCFLLPIGVLLYTLFRGYSLPTVATRTCLTVLVTYIFSDLSLRGMKERLRDIPHHLETAGVAVARVVPILVCASIVLFLLGFTGLTPKLTALIVGIAGANVVLSLVVTAALVMLLGCGLPVSAAYILAIAVTGPLMIGWGILPLAAHLFAVYFAITAGITPPICASTYVASGIAQSNWLKTAWVALRMAPLLYLMPFLFVSDATFIMIGTPWAILLNVGTAAIGVTALASGMWGYFLTECNIPERLALIALGILLLIPGWQTDLLGVALVPVILVKQLRQRRKLSLGIQK